MATEQGPGRGRGRRWLRRLAIALMGTVLAVVIWVLALIVTNPDASPSPGWARHPSLDDARGEVASTVADGELVVAGGLRGMGQTTDHVSAYDAAASEWRDLPDLPARRHHAAAATVDGTIYVLGGGSSATDWTPRRDVWALARDAAEWAEVDPMPEGRLGHAAAVVDGRIHVVGGDGDSTRVLTFEPGGGWTTGAELGEERDHLAAVVRDSEVWAIGGRNGDLTAAVDIYDPATDGWRDGPALPAALSAMAVGVLDDGIHVVGGEDPDLMGGKVFDRHYVLASGASEWATAASPVLAVHGAGHGVVGDRLYVAGGSARQGPLSFVAWTGVTQSFTSRG